MTVGIVDTTVIIHLFRKNPDALAWFEALTDRYSISPITWLEVVVGAPNKAGLDRSKTILSHFDIVYPTPADMDWAMQQQEKHTLTHGVGMNDCLIASVCHRLQMPLYTHNLKHMRVLLDPALVIQPY